MKSKPHIEAMAELCRSDAALALNVINGILTDGDQIEQLDCAAPDGAGIRQGAGRG